MAGWLKLHRELMDHWVSDEPESLAVFIRLICEANFTDARRQLNGRPVTIGRGQLVFSYDKFSGRSGVSVSKLRRIIKRLSDDNTINKQSFSKYSVISITNYESYQGDDKQNAGRTQADDKQTTTLEEGKNSKREDTTPLADNASRRTAVNCPHQEILDKWQEVMPEKSQPIRSMWVSSRQDYKNLSTRWKEMLNRPKMDGNSVLYHDKESGIEWWASVFRYLRESEFLMKDENSWFDLGWLLKSSNFTKIIEGKYHKKG